MTLESPRLFIEEQIYNQLMEIPVGKSREFNQPIKQVEIAIINSGLEFKFDLKEIDPNLTEVTRIKE